MAARILVIEDDEILRYAVAQHLTEAGFEVEEAPDYRHALEILDDDKPLALMLADLSIPGIDGFALARMAKERRVDLKIVHMTGFDEIPADEANGPILHKPVDPEVILSELRLLLTPEHCI
jgi:DNA-binding response OmpR family regulator